MPLALRPRRNRPRQGADGRFTVRSDRDRRALRKKLGRALAVLDRRAQHPGCEVADIQLLARVCPAPSYPAWKRDQERTWKRQGGRYSTASWPVQLGENEIAVVLLPLAAGRVGLAAGKHPRAVADPIFSCGALPSGGGHEDIVLALVTSWVSNPGEGHSARLAPPVVEVFQRGSVVERRLVGFGQQWPLRAPDGV